MMRIVTIFVALLISVLPLLSLATTTISVESCQDLLDAAEATESGNVVAEMNATYINCGSWTTLEVKDNRLKLVTIPEHDDSTTFYLQFVRFLVSSGTLQSDVRLSLGASYTETNPREVNGGVLHVAEDAAAKFNSHVYMTRSVIATTVEDSGDDPWVGGCIYNEGLINFNSGLETDGCSTAGGSVDFGDSVFGDGGTIWNGENGKVVVKESMNLVGDWDGVRFSRLNEGSRGGIIFNSGEFVVKSDAELSLGRAAAGGSIYNEGVFTFRSDAYALLAETYAGGADIGGGAVVNSGTMKFKGGVKFDFAVAIELDGGGVVNSGTLIISEPAEFNQASAERYGGAIATSTSATLEIPDDTIFTSCYVAGINGVYDCDLIYIADESGGYTCGP